ncbi:hypothetical protein ABRP29_09995 [Pseudomonas sp. WHRI 8822A]|uniref:hypothetical protein n=1 Tax=Pseudomonas sp. WHRI 8822A TaxID=3162568 RepID=UPI0032ED7B6E
MKAPTKPAPKKTAPKKDTGKIDGLSVNQALQLAGSSVEGLKAYVDYKKEKEVTKRALIDGERAIRLSEHELTKAHLLDDQNRRSHDARLVELDNQDKGGQRQHEQAMKKLQTDADRENRIIQQLEAQQITAEEAAILLHGTQE